MPRSDEDSSSSADSNSSSEEESGIPGAVRMPAARDEDPSASADPESPSAAQQSSDESGSSDGVLVDLPGNPDQEQGDVHSVDRGEETGREETFLDAPDHLGSARSLGLEESMAMIEIRESSEGRAHDHARLDDTLAECKKYKEEREVFGREVASLRHQLQDMIDRQSLHAANNDELLEHLRRLEKGEGEDNALASPTPLHSMLGDCLKLISHLKGILDEQLNFEGMIRELHAVLYSKDQEIEDLNVKVSESNVSRDVVIAYLGSLRDIWSEALKQSYIAVSRRLVGSLALVLGEECESSEDSTNDGFSLVEKNTLLLIEKHTRVLSEIQQLGLYLAEIRSDFANLEEIEPATVFSAALEELHESKRKEAHLMEKINKLEEENRKMAEQVDRMKDSLEEANAETGKTKIELEQTESKLSTAKEKLSIAVTKGKSLVQHRDSLKQLLAEKTNELEKCLLELQQKSDSLESTKAITEGLKLSLAENTSELERCLLELQHKSDAMEAIEGSTKELKQSLAEQKGEHEKCLLELQEKSDALERTETSAVELEHSLAEKTSELEKCLLELQQRSDDLETAKTSVDNLTEAQNLVHSLQDSLAHRHKVLHEIEQIVSRDDSPQELPSMEVLDRVRWFINQKHISDEESCKIRNALSSIDLPETISSTDLVSQINWLGKSFTQAKDDIIKLQDEISVARILGLSHESELSEAHKEIDHLTSSLLEEKRKKESVQDELQDVRYKYEEMTENLPKNSAERDGLMKVLVEVSESALDDQPYVDTDTMIEKCIGQIREKAKNYLTEREHFDRMQTLLYVKDQDLMLCETILEEVMIDRTEMMSLSTECGRASEEIVTLKNEKEFLQKELERVEERSSLLREKLSMAVKKGKGLVQEREGLKLSLDEKSSEIERLKQELQHQDSAVFEYKEQIRSLSSYPEHIQKLESEIVSLKDQRDEIERFLLESNSTLQRLLDSIESIVLPTDENFEGPIEKVNWIAENIRKSEVAKALAEQELEKVKVEATLQARRLADAFTTIKSLEDQLSKEELQISVITEEKNETQLGKTLIEQELEKVKEESYMQASKLEDAYTNIKSLEDALSSANTHISLLNTEMNETESKSKQDINILNVKLADCMEELTKTQCSLANQSEDLVGHIERLWMLMKDETLFSMITENFRNKIEDLRKMGHIIQNMHDQFASKGLHIHPGSEYPEFPNLSLLPQFDDFIKERMVHSETVTADLASIPSFTKIVQELGAQATFFRDSFQDVSTYMDDHITLTVQALQAARDEFIYMIELRESSKLNVNKLEAQNEAQEVKMLSLQKEIKTLLSACADATQELQIEFPDFLDVGSDSEQQKDNFSLESRSKEAAGGGIEEEVAGESANAMKSLLLTARRIRNQFQQLANVRNMWMTSADDLEHRLRLAEFTAETAIQDGNAKKERISKLEWDLEALQNICSEMKIKIEDYQAKENMLRDKEAELLSLHHSLTAKDTGIGDELFSQDEMETLIDKVNRMEIPFSDLDAPTQEVHFSSPVDKLFYIIDKVTEFKDKMESLGFEKEEMQLSLASQVCEVEHLKKAAETIDIDYEDFESKKSELIEVAVGLERIIQRLGGNYSFEDQKLITAMGLLPVVERLTIASSMESENLKSRIQELVAKLQAKEKVVDELLEKVKLLEDSFHARLAQPDTMKERTVFESSSTVAGSEISEIEDVGPPVGKNSKSPATAAAHVRTMRKGSNDHLVLSIDSESDRLIGSHETDDKGHVFKSLNTSDLGPKQGKLIADRIDGIWVSGGRFLMSRPRARLGLIAYWIFLHLWLLGTIL